MLKLEDSGKKLAGRTVWRLLEDYHWSPFEVGIQLTVPTGFESDLAALPALIRPKETDTYKEAALVHDYLASRPTAHIFADAMFLIMLAEMDLGMARNLLVRGYLFFKRLLT